MKKNGLCFLFLVFSSLNGSANSVADYIKIKNLETQFKVVSDSMQSLQSLKKEFNSLKIEKSSEVEKLKQNLDNASHTIEAENSFLHGFGTLYGVISCFITIIVVIIGAFPIAFYFFSLKPSIEENKERLDEARKGFIEFDTKSKDLVREIEKDANKYIKKVGDEIANKINEQLEYVNKNKIDQYIGFLGNVEQSYERIGGDFLLTQSYNDLDFEQRYKLCKVIAQKNINDSNKRSISQLTTRLITYKKSDVAEDFVKNILENSTDFGMRGYAIDYLIDKGKGDLASKYAMLRRGILDANNPGEECVGLLLDRFATPRVEYISELTNDKGLIDFMNSTERDKIVAEFRDSKYVQCKEVINASYLYTRYYNQPNR